ncbi:MAG: salY [Chthoniobacteraceae bacterium]|nr:salY [Chthoniobacteraceae bacterium]
MSQFLILFWWHVVRNFARHRLLALLNVLSIALGIAVYLAIQIANGSANRALGAGVDLVAGKTQLEVRGEIDETLWPTIAKQPGVRASTAVLEGVVTLPDYPGEYLKVLGIDLFTNEPFSTFKVGLNGERVDFEKWLATPGGVALSREFVGKLHIGLGTKIRVLVNSVIKEMIVLAVIDPGDSPAATQPRFAVMDLGWAQELFGYRGRISSVQLLLNEPERTMEVAKALRAQLPPNLVVEPPRQRSFQMQQMLAAFQLNLGALSLVSLLVGTFLIYTTVSASVTRRRAEIGILRALGTTRFEVRSLFLGEACFCGLLGILLGTFGGIFLARFLVGAVARTISSLYLLVSIEHPQVALSDLLLAAIFGFGAVFAGAWLPANEAARISPLAALSLGTHAERTVVRAHRWHWFGCGFLSLGLLLSAIALHFGPAVLGFAAAFFVLAGFAFFAPGLTLGFGAVVVKLLPGTLLIRLAAENLQRSLHRTGITVAALSVAVAMMSGLTTMIFSFRNSLNSWVDRAVVADLFIAPASNETIGLNAFIPEEAISWLRGQPGVEGVDSFRELPVAVDSERALLSVINGVYRHNMRFLGGGAEEKMALVCAGKAVVVSESFERRFHTGKTGRITLATPKGRLEFQVAGVFSDYTRDQGIILMARPLFDQFWQEPRVQSLSVYLHPGVEWAPVAEAFQARFGGAGEFTVYSNRSLRERIVTIFNQTFTVTYLLRTIAVLVALVGIFLTVTTLVTERAREIGVLRAIGASRPQVQGLFMVESAMIGLLASTLGVASGLALAMVLTWVVNPAFFGWSIELRFPIWALISTPLWIVPAAIAAAWIPSWRASRAVIAQSIREE